MKKIITAMVGAAFMGGAFEASATSIDKLDARLDKSAQVLRESQAKPDHAVPRALLDQSHCVTVIPNVLRAGFVFGGKRGRGVSSCRTAEGWSHPVFTDVSGASWGLQIGVQSTDLVLVWTRPDAVSKLAKGDLTLGGGASVAAGPVGRDAALATDFVLKNEVYSYSRSRGLFAGLTLEGAVMDYDNSDNGKYYNNQSGVTLLTSTPENTTQSVNTFLTELNTLAPLNTANPH